VTPPSTSLWKVIERRRSSRRHGPGPLDLAHVALLLRAAYGTTGAGPADVALRAVPSAGALYPLDVYVAAARLGGVDRDVHHYDPLRNVLERVRRFDPAELDALTPYPELLRDAAAILVVVAAFWRTRFKYGQRGYRFALLEAGHLAQNLLLSATALDLASTPLGGFFDRQVNAFVDVDGLHEAALYVLPIGPPGAT
jgi:SagB-type dehydrogenase family enzyme